MRSTTRGDTAALTPRAILLELARASPGCSTGRLRARACMTWGTFSYHLDLLARDGKLRLVEQGARTFVFPAGVPATVSPAESVLASRTAQAIARAIVEGHGASVRSLVEATGESPRATYYHVASLVAAALVVSASRSRYVDLQPTEQLLAELADHARDAAPSTAAPSPTDATSSARSGAGSSSW